MPELNALFTVNVPESDRISLIGETILREAETLDPGAHVLAVLTGSHHSGNIALDVRKKYGNSHIAERLSHDLERHSLACAGRSGDQAVPVCLSGQKTDFLSGIIKSQPNFAILIHFVTPVT